ncbi:MAG: Holliday junction resolvase RuvX [Pelagibacteraceae bacterium]|nr:Holliday junction resolvase RuvX [Pelagibacteraceae bacterium]
MLSIDEFKKNITINSRLLGIDPGKKNIGLAICDENKAVATPFKTLIKNNFESLFKEINKIIQENEIKGIVIGNPVNMDGSLGRSAQSSMDFAKNLSKNITIPITLWDERLSSEGAFKMTKDLNNNVTTQIKNLDKNSAAFILQGAIDYLTN